ncbi:MAG: UDP-N-acetylmuramate dehydrogenase [Eggerthellaceae bacterium]|jgi:UDP-N-acetylmuramate dehydrogenase
MEKSSEEEYGVNKEKFKQDLYANLGKENVFIDEPMSKHTTFKIGGPAEFYLVPRTFDQVAYIKKLSVQEGIGLRVIGYGSDLLISDAGLRGIVMQIADNLSAVSVAGNYLSAQAGASNKKVADSAAAAGLAGYEFASGIPGGIGGAAIMNAGAYDGEFAQVAESLKCLNSDGEVVTVSREDAKWGYRQSMMNDAGMLVLEARLKLLTDDRFEIYKRMKDLEERRASKQPLEMPSAGSTFKRPEGHYAGKLIQDSGMQGYQVGGAQVSLKHAGFVVNTGHATASDVRQLIADVQDRVYEFSGVRLEPEVRYWGDE